MGQVLLLCAEFSPFRAAESCSRSGVSEAEWRSLHAVRYAPSHLSSHGSCSRSLLEEVSYPHSVLAGVYTYFRIFLCSIEVRLVLILGPGTKPTLPSVPSCANLPYSRFSFSPLFSLRPCPPSTTGAVFCLPSQRGCNHRAGGRVAGA